MKLFYDIKFRNDYFDIPCVIGLKHPSIIKFDDDIDLLIVHIHFCIHYYPYHRNRIYESFRLPKSKPFFHIIGIISYGDFDIETIYAIKIDQSDDIKIKEKFYEGDIYKNIIAIVWTKNDGIWILNTIDLLNEPLFPERSSSSIYFHLDLDRKNYFQGSDVLWNVNPSLTSDDTDIKQTDDICRDQFMQYTVLSHHDKGVVIVTE